MPALPNVPNVLRLTLTGLLGEDLDVVNRWFIQYTGTPPTNSQLDTFAAAVLTEWVTNLAAKFMAGYATEGVTVEDLTSPTGAVGHALGSHAGTDTGVTLGAATSFIIRNVIGRRYRGGHSRTYLAGVSNSHLQDDQKWDPTFAAGLATAWIAFQTALRTHAWAGATLTNQVNVSYYSGFHNFTFPSGRTRPIPTLRGTPLIDVVTQTSWNPRPGSQRRRNLQGS